MPGRRDEGEVPPSLEKVRRIRAKLAAEKKATEADAAAGGAPASASANGAPRKKTLKELEEAGAWVGRVL